MDLTTRVLLKVTPAATKAIDFSKTASATPELSISETLADGTGLDEADQVYHSAGTLGADADVDIDLSGSLTDVFGDTVTFARIKMILFENTSTNASTLQFGGGDGQVGTNAWDTWIGANSTVNPGSEYVKIPKGGALALFAPDATAWTVTAGTGDILTIKELSSVAAAYSIVIVGATA